MRFLSLFTGIGGFDLGLERAGHECVGQVEIDAFCRRVLARRFPSVWSDEQGRWPHLSRVEDCAAGDEQLHGAAGWIDLLCGGFPCQDLSVAGKRAGLSGERSGLFHELTRIAKALRPAWGLVENVPGLLSSSAGRDFWTVLNGLRECWPVVGYRVLDSQHFGVAQRRRRVFLVGGPTEAGVRAVLFEPESGGGDSQEGGQATEGVAEPVARSITSTCFKRHDTDTDTDTVIVTGALKSQPGGWRIDAEEAADGRLVTAYNWQSGGDVRHGFGKPSLHVGQTPAVGVRRLTPLECERLQGFPDGWTCLCGTDDHELGCKCPDSPRYRALGNAITVNVAEWLGKRLAVAS